ncbi:hypothetical protein DAEQUDRAFT_570057 [Daedalea quercina L-15889]|uniref:Uncharacterized protein n=1 Tax=Daedalea quercina L-15889 TaxID=1314783 RepID=A0A165LWD8_9APHY|nr:hypothetical protein DAEQUDRAFT_570057 [Daedalea quercina L-15889]
MSKAPSGIPPSMGLRSVLLGLFRLSHHGPSFIHAIHPLIPLPYPFPNHVFQQSPHTIIVTHSCHASSSSSSHCSPRLFAACTPSVCVSHGNRAPPGVSRLFLALGNRSVTYNAFPPSPSPIHEQSSL